ncbi:MAG: endonuclease/exonuclease/phosphatase family protein [Oceanipulchritudo sp.]
MFAPASLLLPAGEVVTVATFNAEWLGYPTNSDNWNGSRSTQIEAVAAEILALEADIVALQEVIVDPVNGNALQDLVDELNAVDPLGMWEGDYNPKFSIWWNPDFEAYPAQRQAYVWRSATVRFLSSEVMLDQVIDAGDRLFASGRLPFLLRVEAGPVGFRREVQLINLHLKCCRTYDDRRAESMIFLLDELYSQYAEVSLIVLGDFNVADRGGAYGEISEWGFYDDDDGDGAPDFAHAAGAVADLNWDDIDHIMVSNELLPYWERLPVEQRNGITSSFVSDHPIVYTRLDFSPPSVAEQYEAWIQTYLDIEPAIAAMSAFEDDYDRDDLANGLEFMTGTSPIRMDAGLLTIEPGTAGSLRLNYRQRKGLPASSLSLSTSTSLGNPSSWSRMVPDESSLTVADDDDPAIERVSVQIRNPSTPEPVMFRLEAVLEP